jgi:TonB-dependent receptor
MPGWVSNPTPFSLVLDGSYREDERGFDDIEEDYSNTPHNPTDPIGKAYNDLQLRLYNYHRRRFGYGGEFDFKPNDDNRFYIRANVFGYVESVKKNRLEYDNIDGSTGYPVTLELSDPNDVVTQGDLTLHGTNEEETHRNSVFAFGGENNISPVQIDYRVAYSRATFFVGRNYSTNFTGPTGVHLTYDNITMPNFPELQITDGTNPNDPTLYRLTKSSRLKNSTENDADQEWSYAGNAALPLDIFGDDDHLKFGFEVRLRNKVAKPYTQTFSFTTPLQLSSLSPLPPDTTFYHGRYTNGPGINEGAILTDIRNGTITPSSLDFDPTGFFNADENIYAGYGMYTGSFGSWGVLAGARVESTNAKYGFFDFDAAGDVIGFLREKHNYTDIFPTVQLRYEFAPDLIGRATYSTGIGRPGFTQLAKPVSVDDSADSVTIGNPALRPTTGNNFDLDLEDYLGDAGILQFGAFDKEFKDYIFASNHDVASDPHLPGIHPVHIVSFGNIGSAYARGIEAGYNQKFTFLPAPFDAFGLDSNITFVSSSGEVRPGENHSLPGTSPITFNVAAFYENDGLQLRLASQYVGHSLYQVGGSRQNDQFEDSRFTLDFTSSYEICNGWLGYFNVRNITNAPLRIYLGAPNWPIQREFYDQTYEAGLRVKL